MHALIDDGKRPKYASMWTSCRCSWLTCICSSACQAWQAYLNSIQAQLSWPLVAWTQTLHPESAMLHVTRVQASLAQPSWHVWCQNPVTSTGICWLALQMLWLAIIVWPAGLYKSCSPSTTTVCSTTLSTYDSCCSDISCLCDKRTPVPDLDMTRIVAGSRQRVQIFLVCHLYDVRWIYIENCKSHAQGDVYKQYWFSAIGHTAKVCMLG